MQFIVTLAGNPSALLILPDAGRSKVVGAVCSLNVASRLYFGGLGYSQEHLPALFDRGLVIFVLYLLSIS